MALAQYRGRRDAERAAPGSGEQLEAIAEQAYDEETVSLPSGAAEADPLVEPALLGGEICARVGGKSLYYTRPTSAPEGASSH